MRWMIVVLAALHGTALAGPALAQSHPTEPRCPERTPVERLHSAYRAAPSPPASPFSGFLREADSLLALTPPSVMDKTQTPASGDKHDFMSMGPYWWPDPDKPDGLPYIRRDGRRNPEYLAIPDQESFETMRQAVDRLSLAHAVTRDARYAAKAVAFLRVWFLDEATRMNPNMNHAQLIPGICTGRGIGIIETRRISTILDALCLLAASREWTPDDDERMTRWLASFLDWLTTHQYGIDESNEMNNHGTWYDVQAVSLALFLGNGDLARVLLERAKLKRIAVQIAADGRQPLELARTNSWSYSLMNLTGLFRLAALGDRAGVDLWTYHGAGGGSLRTALDYLLPFAADRSRWPHQQIGAWDNDPLYRLLLVAQEKFDGQAYTGWITRLFPGRQKTPIDELLRLY